MKSKKTILVMEDDEAILEVTKLMLRGAGYTVMTALDDQVLREKIATTIPDLILMDVWVPDHDARSITHYLKSNPKTQHIPIILFSATPQIEKIVEEAGADDFIPKPFDMDYFLDTIKKYIS